MSEKIGIYDILSISFPHISLIAGLLDFAGIAAAEILANSNIPVRVNINYLDFYPL